MAFNESTEDDDYLRGTEDADVLEGLGGNDYVLGEGGDDELRGGDGDDMLYSQSGNFFDEVAGVDSLYGDAGDDDLWLQGVGGLADGGEGFDLARVDVESTDVALDVDLRTGAAVIQGAQGEYRLVSIERIALTAGSGDDSIVGGEGEDEIYGRDGDDEIHGGGGDDYLNGGGDPGSVERLHGDGGDDYLAMDEATGVADGGAGDDTVYLDFREREGDVRLDLTTPTATVVGVDGLIIRNVESVVVDFGAGDDRLVGGTGEVDGESGEGDDHLDATRSSEADLSGEDGDDTLLGGAGEDDLDGGAGSDVIKGGAGDDDIDVGSDFGEGDSLDKVDAGAGDDEVRIADGRAELDGGAGVDTLDIALFFGGDESGYVYRDGVLRTGEGRVLSTVRNFETLSIYGSDYADSFVGGAGADDITGAAGDDKLVGGGGDDYLSGDDGADRYEGGAGDDDIYMAEFWDAAVDTLVLGAGAGSDEVIGFDTAQDVFDLGGRLFVEVQPAVELQYDWWTETEVEVVVGTRVLVERGEAYLDGASLTEDEANALVVGFNPTKVGTAAGEALNGTTKRDIVDAGAGNDTLSGGAGSDDLYGRAGADKLDGGLGDDFLAGGEGADRLNGGLGVDKLFGGAGDDVLELGWFTGADQLDGGGGIDMLTFWRPLLLENVTIDLSDPGVRQTTADGSTVINVERLDIATGFGRDVLTGGGLADRIFGGANDDRVFGGAGDDVLSGEWGRDALFGGDGHDTVVFSGRRADYRIRENDDGTWTVTGQKGLAVLDGVDVLTDIEALQFADGGFLL